MRRLELALLLALGAAFVLSGCALAGGDLQVGLSGLNLALLLTALNVINLLNDIRNELRRLSACTGTPTESSARA